MSDSLTFDVIVIGAGPAGLCSALSLARMGLRVGVIERQSAEALAAPAFDGREIALTHRSVQTLQDLGVWPHISADDISPLRDALVMSGGSRSRLFFDHRDARCGHLGLLVPNHAIRAAVHGRVAAEPRIRVLDGRRLEGLTFGPAAVQVRTDRQEELRCRLLIGADSRFSDTRRAVGIGADMVDFGKTMLVCRMRHERDHDQTAWEWFQNQFTVALLPLGGRESSVVITVPAADAQRLHGLDAAAFDREITAQFERRLGDMTLSSTRHLYPLVATYSRRFIAPRCALVGDAAVGMHPVTAHGFNLGLQSQECLVRELARRADFRSDVGEPRALERYESVHRRQSRLLYLGTNAIVRVYTDSRPLHRVGRVVGLGLVNRLPPVKRLMMSALTAVD
jgi:ubiquinone biosynthesis UbiH/UbiF/VisC/COQ6 family hydroxylase